MYFNIFEKIPHGIFLVFNMNIFVGVLTPTLGVGILIKNDGRGPGPILITQDVSDTLTY